MLRYKHTREFYEKQYEVYKKELADKPGYNKEAFISAYKSYEASGLTNIRKNLVYEAKYEISYDTYKAEKKAMKELGKKVRAKDLLTMSTTEFAKKYAEDIMAYYNTFKDDDRKEVSDFISTYFFGSM